MMKKTRSIGMVVAVLFMVMAGSSAMAVIAGDSTLWEGAYEADAMPAGDFVDQDGSVAAQGGSIQTDGTDSWLHMDNANAWGYAGVLATDGQGYVANANTNGGAAYEVRSRFNGGSWGNWGHLMTSATSADGHYNWLTYYVEDGAFKINNSNSFGNENATISMDTSEFHTYRFVNDNVNWSLYIDGSTTAAASINVLACYDDFNAGGYDGYAGRATFYWGDTGDLDYIRYTDTVPEPATMGLLALGGLFLRRRKR